MIPRQQVKTLPSIQQTLSVPTHPPVQKVYHPQPFDQIFESTYESVDPSMPAEPSMDIDPSMLMHPNQLFMEQQVPKNYLMEDPRIALVHPWSSVQESLPPIQGSILQKNVWIAQPRANQYPPTRFSSKMNQARYSEILQ